MARLRKSFYARPAEVVARELIGARVVSTIDDVQTAGVIVEAEAYVGPDDPASHAAKRIGRTARNESMYGPPGTAYVYRLYGHHCLNVVTDSVGFPAAVLIRALAPVAGIDVMRTRRWPGVAPGRDRDTARGPGNLTRALGITSDMDGHLLTHPPLWLEMPRSPSRGEVVVGRRIGVTRAADWQLRFFLRDSPHVSAHRRI